MNINLARLHLFVGIVGMLVFVLTGQHMALIHNGLVDMADGPRVLIRTAHLYIMLCSAINIVIGIYARELRISLVQVIISSILISAPIFMTLEYFFGTLEVNTLRPFAYIPLIAVFAAMALLVLRAWWEQRRK
ncbi:MAG: hypothetical protein AAF431_10585 [Pseudomonadota bacterium]